MEIAYLHVVINHLPIMGVPIALGLLLLGIWARNDAIKRAALLVFFALGIATVAVFLTGKGGEDFVEHAAGISEDAIEAHEDVASIAFAAVSVLALLSLAVFLQSGGLALLRRRDAAPGARVPASGVWLVALVAVGTAAILGYTGRLGGKISHTEFATGAQTETPHTEAADAEKDAAEEAEDAEKDAAEAAEESADEAAEAAEEAAEPRRRKGRGRR